MQVNSISANRPAFKSMSDIETLASLDENQVRQLAYAKVSISLIDLKAGLFAEIELTCRKIHLHLPHIDYTLIKPESKISCYFNNISTQIFTISIVFRLIKK